MRPETLTCRIGAGLSASPLAADAAADAAREACAGLADAEIDLAFLFLSAEHLDDAEEALGAAQEELAAAHLLGCVAEGVVARDRELEEGRRGRLGGDPPRRTDRALPRGRVRHR